MTCPRQSTSGRRPPRPHRARIEDRGRPHKRGGPELKVVDAGRRDQAATRPTSTAAGLAAPELTPPTTHHPPRRAFHLAVAPPRRRDACCCPVDSEPAARRPASRGRRFQPAAVPSARVAAAATSRPARWVRPTSCCAARDVGAWCLPAAEGSEAQSPIRSGIGTPASSPRCRSALNTSPASQSGAFLASARCSGTRPAARRVPHRFPDISPTMPAGIT